MTAPVSPSQNINEAAAEIASLRSQVSELRDALRNSEGSLSKIANWLMRLAVASEQRAKDNRFSSLADANAADAKNYRATIASIMPVLETARKALAVNSQDRGSK